MTFPRICEAYGIKIHTDKPENKGHSEELENMTFMSSCLLYTG